MASVALLREFLFRREAIAAAKRIPDDVRQPVRQALQLGRQKHRAASALWDADQHQEAQRIAVDALHTTLRGAQGFARHTLQPDSPVQHSLPDPWDQALAWMRTDGAKERSIRAVQRAREACRLALEPKDDGEGYAVASQPFDEILVAQRCLDRRLSKAAASPEELSYRRLRLWLLMALGLVLVGVFVWKTINQPWGLTVTASAFYGNDPQHGPQRVLDGSATTEWLLPDNAAGWLDIRSNKPRDIKTIRILNGHNPGFDDRAVKEYRIEVFSRGAVAQTVAGSFQFSSTPQWVSHPIGVKHVDRVRITVGSWHARGAGLAEIEIK